MLACLQIFFFSLQTTVTEDSDSDVEDMCNLIEKSHCHLMHAEKCIMNNGLLIGDDCVCIYFARFIHLIIRLLQTLLKFLLLSYRRIKTSFRNFITLPNRICNKFCKKGLSIANCFKFFKKCHI